MVTANLSSTMNPVARAFIGLLVLAWLLWAVMYQDPQSSRIKKISEALSRGEIGKLTEGDRQFVNQIVPWLLEAAGQKETRWSLNLPVIKSELSIFTVSSDAYDVTYTSEGNAVYDAELDAIFLHENLVHGITYVDDGLGNKSETGWTDQTLYLAFTILHELGHRQLHAKSGALFDMHSLIANDPDARARELEADNFAFDTLLTAYALDIESGTKFLGYMSEEALNYVTGGRADDAPVHRIRLDLDAANFIENWFRNEIENGDISPFHFTKTHPNFAFRIRSLSQRVEPALFSGTAREIVYRSIDIVDRIDSIAPRLLQQVSFPFPVVATAISDQRLLGVSPTGQWASARLANSSLKVDGKYAAVSAQMSEEIPRVPVPTSALLTAMVSHLGEPWLAIDNKSMAYIFDGKSWVLVRLPEPEQPDTRYVYKGIWQSTVKPQRNALMVSSDIDLTLGVRGVHLIADDGTVKSKTIEEIEKELRSRLGTQEELTVGFGSFSGDRVCLSVFTRDELELLRLSYVVSYDFELVLTRLFDFSESGEIKSLSEVSTLCRNDENEFVVVGRHYQHPGYGVWDVIFRDGKLEKAKLRTRVLHLGERVEDRDYDQPSSSLFAAKLVGDQEDLHLSLWFDGYFSVKEDGKTDVLFHPGDGTVSFSEKLMAIVPGRGSRNVYLVDSIFGN